MHQFSNVTASIFVVALCAYDQFSSMGKDFNLLQEALDLFNEMK